MRGCSNDYPNIIQPNKIKKALQNAATPVYYSKMYLSF